eukprot:CAMPEP_0179884694 /NCGR_PEP_ID=MMETSP0982-20121206/29801_1 /TAXON_ID=483367 /ORGANISM="non described non described, Strain CCMP 2436" /LENGTH=170 /DNA_ID=CAMNT_0021780059 /DNA_START=68 /DNA_END=581 /DNA_ORIENTATION=+
MLSVELLLVAATVAESDSRKVNVPAAHYNTMYHAATAASVERLGPVPGAPRRTHGSSSDFAIFAKAHLACGLDLSNLAARRHFDESSVRAFWEPATRASQLREGAAPLLPDAGRRRGRLVLLLGLLGVLVALELDEVPHAGALDLVDATDCVPNRIERSLDGSVDRHDHV